MLTSACKALVDPNFTSLPSEPHPTVSLRLCERNFPVLLLDPDFITLDRLPSLHKPRITLKHPLDPVPLPKHNPSFSGATADEPRSGLSSGPPSTSSHLFPISCTNETAVNVPFEILFVFSHICVLLAPVTHTLF